MQISKSTIKSIAEETFNEVMNELSRDASPIDSPENVIPTKTDKVLGNDAAKLAQLKGELATVLDRAESEGIISRGEEGKIRIIKLPEYQKVIGTLPQQIKILRRKVLGDTNI